MSKIFDIKKFLNIISIHPRLDAFFMYLTCSYSNFATFFYALENLACDTVELLCECGELRCHLSEHSDECFLFDTIQMLCQGLCCYYSNDIRYLESICFCTGEKVLDSYEFWEAFLQCIPIPQDLEFLSFEDKNVGKM